MCNRGITRLDKTFRETATTSKEVNEPYLPFIALGSCSNMGRAYDILPLAKQLMSQVEFSASHPIRLLGLGVSGHADDNAKKVQPRPEWRELELEFLPW